MRRRIQWSLGEFRVGPKKAGSSQKKDWKETVNMSELLNDALLFVE